MLLRSPFSLLSELVLFSGLWRDDFSMVGHRPVRGEHAQGGIEGEWKESL